jgi:hypothetical protein
MPISFAIASSFGIGGGLDFAQCYAGSFCPSGQDRRQFPILQGVNALRRWSGRQALACRRPSRAPSIFRRTDVSPRQIATELTGPKDASVRPKIHSGLSGFRWAVREWFVVTGDRWPLKQFRRRDDCLWMKRSPGTGSNPCSSSLQHIRHVHILATLSDIVGKVCSPINTREAAGFGFSYFCLAQRP